MHNIRLETTLEEWRAWPVTKRPTVIQAFSDGLNHEVFLIHDGARELVLKLFSQASKSAIDAQQWAANLNLAPAIVFASDKHNYALMERVPHPSITPSTTRTKLKTIAKGLSTIHNADFTKLEGVTGNFELLKFCDRYLAQLGKQENYASIIATHQALAPALKIFVEDHHKAVFCHNDLVAENCILTESGVNFIDWEYAQIHNPWFDLAAIIVYLKLNESHASYFLDCYQTGLAAKINTEIFYASQIALLWGDILWHLAKFGFTYIPKLKAKLSTLDKLAANLNIGLPEL